MVRLELQYEPVPRCQHGCIYCDSRSACYEIDDFTDIQVKVNALELLERELSRKRVKGTIGTGSMNDPYMPLEQQNLSHIFDLSNIIQRNCTRLYPAGIAK